MGRKPLARTDRWSGAAPQTSVWRLQKETSLEGQGENRGAGGGEAGWGTEQCWGCFLEGHAVGFTGIPKLRQAICALQVLGCVSGVTVSHHLPHHC